MGDKNRKAHRERKTVATASTANSATNREGLTFTEWCAAAQVEVNRNNVNTQWDAFMAWGNGEDPTDWRAERQRRERGK